MRLSMKLFTFGWGRLRAAATHDRSSVWAAWAAAQRSAREVRPCALRFPRACASCAYACKLEL
jgi:hypothetical protein